MTESALMLRNVSFCTLLPDEELLALQQVMVTKRLPKHSLVMSTGEMSDSMYLIVKGKVKVFISDETGKEIILAQLGPSEFFGELSLLDDQPRSATVMTTENSEFMVLSQASFNACMDKYPSIARYALKSLAARLRQADQKISHLALMDVYGRIAATLKTMAVTEAGQTLVKQRPSHQEIGSMVGASREMVGKILKEMASNGAITIEDKSIILHLQNLDLK